MSGTMTARMPAAWAAMMPMLGILEGDAALGRHAQPARRLEIEVGTPAWGARRRRASRARRSGRAGRRGRDCARPCRGRPRWRWRAAGRGRRGSRAARQRPASPGRARSSGAARWPRSGSRNTVEIEARRRSGPGASRCTRATARRPSHGRSRAAARGPACRAASCMAGDVDGFAVDQRAIHVENDGLDGFLEHGFVLSSRPETTSGRKIHAHP